jgi:hypothetical protein
MPGFEQLLSLPPYSFLRQPRFGFPKISLWNSIPQLSGLNRRTQEFPGKALHSMQRKRLRMSRSPTTNNWRELYADALEDFDPARIEEAQKAVQRRAREIYFSGPPETKERRELAAAIYFLNLFSLAEKADENGIAALITSTGNYDA